MPEVGCEYGQFGTKDLFFRNTHPLFKDGVEIPGRQWLRW